jgi:O-antigen ligase
MNIYQYYYWSLVSCILFIPISVSLSQLFLAFSLLFFLLDKEKLPIRPTPLLFTPVFIFSAYTVSYIVQGFWGEECIRLEKTEIKDIFLFSGFILLYGLREPDYPRLLKVFWIASCIFILTGFISIFSPIRLSRLISDIYSVSTSWKFSHHYGDILGIKIHLPIGLMNTHLTFGGQLLLLSPLVFLQGFMSLLGKKTWKEYLLLLLGVLLLVVLLLNNARSALAGLAICMYLGFIDLYRKGLVTKHIFFGAGVLLPILLLSLFVIFMNHPTGEKFIRPLLGSEKHTDSGRTFIWDSTYPMIKQNPIWGIGPGQYLKKVDTVRKERSVENKELLFFYEVTQRGHAHNDILHIMAIAGVPAGFLFILMSGFCGYAIFTLKQYQSYSILFYGLLGLLVAGNLQCYFQDDEVVILFWILLGFLNRIRFPTKSQEKLK